MDLISSIFEHIAFYINIFFGGFINLIWWVGISVVLEKIAKKGKVPVAFGFIACLLISFLLANAVYHWGLEMYHVGISTPGFHETDAEAQSKAAGFGYGFYYANWFFMFIALFMGFSSMLSKTSETKPAPEITQTPEEDSCAKEEDLSDQELDKERNNG